MRRLTIFGAIVCFAGSLSPAVGQEFEPTEHHKVLEQDEGTWVAKGKMWMPDSPEPAEFEGVETNRMIGGLWSITHFEGNFFGQEFVGHGMTGWDMEEEKYIGSWVDSMSPYQMKMMGTYDPETKILTMMSTGKNPQTGENARGKSTLHYKDENTRVMTMYEERDGEMVKSMEIVYVRKSDG